jgi:signal transduction histidine kinase
MRRVGLFFKLGFGSLLVVAIAFAVNSALTIRAGRGPLSRLVEDHLSLHAQTTLGEVRRYVMDRGREIRMWSGLGTMDEVLTTDRTLQIENLLLELQRENPGRYVRIEVLATDGTVIASTEVSRIGTRREIGVARVTVPDEPGFWLGPYPGETGLVERTIAVANPIQSRFRPEPIGWLVGDAAWSGIARVIDAARLGGNPQDKSSFIALFDASGRLLGGDPDLVEQIPVATTLAAADFDGVETREMGAAGRYLVAVFEQTIGDAHSESPLRIVAVWRSDEAHGVVSGFVRAVLSAAALGLGLATCASFVTTRHLTRRISDLGVGTHRVAEGDLAYRFPVAGGDELDDLAVSFNRMGRRLREVQVERERLKKEILEVAETERKRVGQDLHDGLGQALTGTALLAKSLETTLRNRGATEAEQAAVICKLVNGAIEQTRDVARGLFPSILEAAGLRGALEDLAAGVQTVSEVECRLSIAEPFEEPSDPFEALHLYRIAQESINNALKHGDPSTIEVSLTREGRTGCLTIRDDGLGPPAQVEKGMGLRLMDYRAALIGATLEFRGRPGEGSEVSCRFELDPAAAEET